MDHLPGIKLCEGAFLKVPYLADRDYDGGLFEGYPQRRGWDLKRLLSRDFYEHAPDVTASFLQTWLFFGTLHEIFERDGGKPSAVFVTEDEEANKWISTTNLDTVIREWAEYLNSIAGEEGKVATSIAKLAACLVMLHKMTNALYECESSPVPEEVVISMKVLGSTIDAAFVWFWDLRRQVSWGLRDLSASRMFSQGWCPRDVALTTHYLSEIAMLYVSYIKRDYLRQDHSSCSEKICSVNQIKEVSYRTKHTTANCRCDHVQPDQDQIRKILAKGQVPVISLTPKVTLDGIKTLDVGVKAHRYLRWFIAISHVWSDGLGNSQKNSLPMCQLQVLYDLAVDLPWDEMFGAVEEELRELKTDPEISEKWYDRVQRVGKSVLPATQNAINAVRDRRGRPVSIWIDTLCVPLDKTFRKMAIAGLKNVYSGAMFTIVLDSELQRTSCTCQVEEKLMRIAISGWMRRAWTFQEGVLANARLRVKFVDGVVDLPTLLAPGHDSDDMGIDFYLTQNAAVAKVAQRITGWLDGHGWYDAERQKQTQKEVERKKNYNMSSYMVDEAKAFFSNMQKVWMMPFQTDTNTDIVRTDKVRRIVAAWMGLQWRETSRKEDKFIIFATACITNVDELAAVKSLLNYPVHGRMKLWLSQQYALPASFLFIPDQRYREEGWGWAPLSITTDDLVDDTTVVRSPEDTFLEVKKLGYLLSLPGNLQGSSFVFIDAEKKQRCLVKLDKTYSEAVDAEYRPSLPQRPSEKETLLSQYYEEAIPAKEVPILEISPQKDPAGPLFPPRLPTIPTLSSESEFSFTSQDGFTTQRKVPSLSSKSESSFTNQDDIMMQKKRPKRRIPSDGGTFALILSKQLRLSGLYDGKAAGALTTVSFQSDESIIGLFICPVMVEIVQTDDQSYGPLSTVVQVLNETQAWRVG